MDGCISIDVCDISQERDKIDKMEIVIASFLSIAVLVPVIKLYLLKRQLREIVRQMEEPGENFISVDFVDKDLVSVVLQLNKMIEFLQNIQAEAVRGEKAVRTSAAMISHDMRTPLTSVMGYLQLAEKKCEEEEVRQDIKIALDRAAYCNGLVNDFFELSVIDSEQYTPVMERSNLCEVVCEEILANYIGFEKSGVTPVFRQADDVTWVWADRKLLSRVIQNLISNGIKYAAGKLEFVIVKGEKVSITISSPVSKAVDTEKIFEKYYRADTSGRSEGAGLGLYICRKLMRDMNGDISAYSDGKVLEIKMEMPESDKNEIV